MPDIVPKLPPEILGFTHVNAEEQLSSTGKVKPTLECWHSLSTYLNLLDSTLPIGTNCRLPSASPSIPETSPTAPTSVSVPASPVVVNVTVNVGKKQ